MHFGFIGPKRRQGVFKNRSYSEGIHLGRAVNLHRALGAHKWYTVWGLVVPLPCVKIGMHSGLLSG